MPQTTDYMSWENAKLELAEEATHLSWIDISGSTNSCEAAGGNIPAGVTYTHKSNAPLVGFGKQALRTWVVNAIYTETTDEAWKTAEDFYKGRVDCYLRVTPAGGSAGDLRFTTTGPGRITEFKLPSGKAEDSQPIICAFTLTAPDYETDATPATTT